MKAYRKEIVKEMHECLNASLKDIPDEAKKALSKELKDFENAVRADADEIAVAYENHLSDAVAARKSTLKALQEEAEENDKEKDTRETNEKIQKSNDAMKALYKQYNKDNGKEEKQELQKSIDAGWKIFVKECDDFFTARLQHETDETRKKNSLDLVEEYKKTIGNILKKYATDTMALLESGDINRIDTDVKCLDTQNVAQEIQPISNKLQELWKNGQEVSSGMFNGVNQMWVTIDALEHCAAEIKLNVRSLIDEFRKKAESALSERERVRGSSLSIHARTMIARELVRLARKLVVDMD